MKITLELEDSLLEQIKRDIEERLMLEAPGDDVLSVREAAELMGVSESSVRLLIKGDDSFPYTRLGKKVRIVKSSLIEWLKQRRRVHISDFNGI